MLAHLRRSALGLAGLLSLLGAVGGCASRPKRDPDQSFIRYQLAVEYFKQRRLEAAIEELGKSLKEDPENADAHHMLGIIALRQGHDYVQNVEVQGCLSGPDAQLVRQDSIRKFKEAEGHLRTAVRLRPEFPEAWNNLAVTAIQLEDWPAVVASASEAIKDSTYAEPETARANLGWAYLKMKDTQRAWKELNEAVARSPRHCVARYRLARVYFERGDVQQAAESLDVVLADGRCPIQEAFLLSGMVEQRRKERQRARVLFARCAQMAPRSCTAAECRRYEAVLAQP